MTLQNMKSVQRKTTNGKKSGPIKTFYSPVEAADFLSISMSYLDELVKEGHIRRHRFKKEDFFLGGDLDAVIDILTARRKAEAAFLRSETLVAV